MLEEMMKAAVHKVIAQDYPHLKGIISEWGGTRQGILYNLTALGYEQAHIESVGSQDPERWAEFTVDLGVGNAKAVKDIHKDYNEIQAVKEGSSKLVGLTIPIAIIKNSRSS